MKADFTGRDQPVRQVFPKRETSQLPTRTSRPRSRSRQIRGSAMRVLDGLQLAAGRVQESFRRLSRSEKVHRQIL